MIIKVDLIFVFKTDFLSFDCFLLNIFNFIFIYIHIYIVSEKNILVHQLAY